MLNKNPEERISLEQILVNDWVTNNGTEHIIVDQVEEDKYGQKGFGNIDRLIAGEGERRPSAPNI